MQLMEQATPASLENEQFSEVFDGAVKLFVTFSIALHIPVD